MDYTRAVLILLAAGLTVAVQGDAADTGRKPPAHHSSRPMAICRYLPAGRVIVVNGDTADWHGLPFHPIGRAGSFACVWTRLTFVCAVVVDDMHITAGDRVELHFDLDQEHGSFAKERRRALSLGPTRRRFAWVGDAGQPASRDNQDIANALLDETGISVKQRTGGYIVEMEVPFYALSDKRFPPQSFGFDVCIIDSGETADSTVAVASWSASAASDRDDAGLWGRVVLRPAMYPVKVLLVVLLAISFCLVVAGAVLALFRSAKERRALARVKNQESPRLAALKKYVEENAARGRLRVGDAVAGVGFSALEVEELCAQAGTTFEALLENARVRLAKRLLRDTELTIDQIAAQSGFGSESAMRTAFVKIADATPETFRIKSREEAQE